MLLLFTFLCCFIFQGAIHATLEAAPIEKLDCREESNKQPLITVENYCAFLNNIAQRDPEHLYEAIDQQSCTKRENFIIRSGAPGNYRYETIIEEQRMPMTCINMNDAICYDHWIENTNIFSSNPSYQELTVEEKESAFTEESPFWSITEVIPRALTHRGTIDRELKSNRINFSFNSPCAMTSYSFTTDNSPTREYLMMVGAIILGGGAKLISDSFEEQEPLRGPSESDLTVYPNPVTDRPLLPLQEIDTDQTDNASSFRQNTSYSCPTPKGIHNSGVDCYLNSALQLLRAIYQHSSLEQQQTFNVTTPDSLLICFLQGTSDMTIKRHAASLRLEIANLLKIQGELDDADSSNIDSLGKSIQQADPIDFLRALLPALHIPSIHFGIKRTLQEAGERSEVDITELKHNTRPAELFIPCTISEGTETITIQELIENNLCENRQGYFNTAREEKDKQAIEEESRKNSLDNQTFTPRAPHYDDILIGKKIIGKAPSSLLLSITRLYAFENSPSKIQTTIHGILSNIKIPSYLDGKEGAISYETIAIICHVGGTHSGHYSCYCKEIDGWHLLNDESDSVITDADHEIMQKNSTIIAYSIVPEKRQLKRKWEDFRKETANAKSSRHWIIGPKKKKQKRALEV